jgi:MraZ protein
MFRGSYEQKVDEKGRTSLPRRFREELLRTFSEDRLVVTCSLEPCLWAYPLREWEAFEARVAAQGMFNPVVIKLKRAVIAKAVECTVDSHGRILLPQSLREHAGIEREVVWAGMIGNIEIWARDQWEGVQGEALSDPTGLGKSLAELGL